VKLAARLGCLRESERFLWIETWGGSNTSGWLRNSCDASWRGEVLKGQEFDNQLSCGR
jgi:hypothetical protein